MAHKLLSDLGIKNNELPWNWLKGDERNVEWRAERKLYGFDSRETWSLDFTLSLLVYERLKRYREIAAVELDMQGIAHEYELDGTVYSVGQLIDMALRGFELRLDPNKDAIDYSEGVHKEVSRAWKIIGIIHGSLWW